MTRTHFFCPSCDFDTFDRAASDAHQCGVLPTADQRADGPRDDTPYDEWPQSWLIGELKYLREQLDEVGASLSAAREEGERAKQDTARLDWLNDREYSVLVFESTIGKASLRVYGSTVRDAIDTARSSEMAP
jgi:hypothetical protein